MCSSEQVNKFSTNLCNLEMFYFLDSLIEELLVDITRRQFELISVSRINQSGRQDQQFSAQSLQGSVTPLFWQTKSFEPIDQIVTQEYQMKVDLIGQETVGRYIPQGKAFFEFPDIQFAAGSGFVKMPHVFWAQWKVGNKCMVEVILEFPKRKLVFFFFDFGFGTANYNETVRSFPIPRLITELGCLPTPCLESMITKSLNLFLDRLGHLDHNHVTNPFLVERFDKLVVVESGIGSDTDTVDIFGNLAFDNRPEFLGSGNWMDIPWTQHTRPCVSAVSFETNQRMIAGTSRLSGIVSNFGSFDFPAKDWQDGGIQIEDETAGCVWQIPDFLMQEVVNLDNIFQFPNSQAFQESPQGRRLGELLESQQTLKAVVVMKNSSAGDAFHASYHSIKNSQNQVGWMVEGLSSFPVNIPLQDMFEIQFSTESLKKEHSAIVGQSGILEEKIDISDTLSHLTNMHPVGAFLAEHIDWLDCNSFSSEIPILLSQKHKFLAFFQDEISSFI